MLAVRGLIHSCATGTPGQPQSAAVIDVKRAAWALGCNDVIASVGSDKIKNDRCCSMRDQDDQNSKGYDMENAEDCHKT